RLIMGNANVAESCVVEFASSATNALFATFIILLALALPPLTERDGIHVLLVQGIASVSMLFLGGGVVHRLGTVPAYALSLALATAALTALATAQGFAALALGAVLLSVAASVVHLVNVRMLASLPGGKSKIAGLYNLASMTGASFGAIGGGVLTRFVPVQSIFWSWLPILAVLAGVVALLHLRRRPVPVTAEANA
ncbi:MAG: MFS transporter, partial [Rhizorhabdus sp.]